MTQRKFIGFAIILGLALLTISNTMAHSDEDTTNTTMDMDVSELFSMFGEHFQRGSMDGSGIGDHQQLQDGPGGMYGTGNGTCQP